MSSDVANEPRRGGWLCYPTGTAVADPESLTARSGVDPHAIRDIETRRTVRPRPSTVRRLSGALASTQRDHSPDSHPPGDRPPAQLPAGAPTFTVTGAEPNALEAVLERSEPTTVVS